MKKMFYFYGEVELILQEANLAPCHVCGRTFLPNPLKKHEKICEKNAIKKRKPFDSLKQRVAGTDLADFHQPTYLKKKEEPIVEKNPKQSKWKEKHLELVTAIRAAKGVPSDIMPSSPSPKPRSTTSLIASSAANERCPSCDRHFGPKAFDRHVEWCKERKGRIQQSPASVQQAKERLEARIKYRVPLLNKSKRTLIREKYSTSNSNPNSPEPVLTKNTISTTNLGSFSRGPSIRKPKSLVNVEKVTSDPRERMSRSDIEKCSGERKRNSYEEDRKMSLSFGLPVIGSPSPKAESVKSNASNYDPFEIAQRQFMELLECDDFKPFTPSDSVKNPSRPHTTAPTPLKTPMTPLAAKKTVKSADAGKKGQRASVIDPPVNFKDSMDSVTDNDDFELIENMINEHFGEEPEVETNGNTNGFYLHNLTQDKDSLTLDRILDNRKYSDDMSSSIDPRLINENDDLSIPEHFKIDDYSPTSTADTEITLHNDDIDPYSVQYDSKIEAIEPKVEKKTLVKRSLSLVNRSKRDSSLTGSKSAKPSNNSNSTKKTVASSKTTVSKPSKSHVSSSSSEKPSQNESKAHKSEKKKGLPLLKRSMTLFDPSPKPSFKSKQEVNDYFNGNELRTMSSSMTASMTSGMISSMEKSVTSSKPQTTEETVKVEELFAVDDEMYEEYKKYEEMYLKEKEQSSNSNKKSKNKNVDLNYGLLTASEEEDHSNNSNNKLSNDSAYGSLRKTSKHRSRAPKLSPLDAKHVESTSSSGSENGLNSPAPPSGTAKVPKFCHECGTRFPVSTAKFCVECGVKRLVL